MRTQSSASSHLTMPRLAFNRKDTRSRIDWREARWPPILLALPENAFSVAVSWPAVGPGRSDPGRLTQSWSHRLVIGAAAALRRNPGDVAVRILDVAGFAMDAILGVDLVARARRLLDPFVETRRAVAIRRAVIGVVLGRLLQVHVGDLEMNRLVLFVVGVGQE